MRKIYQCLVIFGFLVILFGFTTCLTGSDKSGSITSFSGSFVERGQPIAELSGYRIAYYEPVPAAAAGTSSETDAVSRGIQETDAPFIMADWGPRDELPQEIKKPSIYVVFSQPVVPLARLGDPIRESSGLFTIDPPLAGTYRWYGSRLLSFEPDAEIIPQHRYTVTVSDRIRSLGGKSLQGTLAFSFETERLSVLDWQLGDGDSWVWDRNVHPEDARQIRMIFSYPVNLAEIAQWIEVRAGGRTWPFTLARLPNVDERSHRPEQGVLLTVNDQLPLNTSVTMVLKEGARSEPGWLGAKEEKSWNYHTLLPFSFESISVQSHSRPRSDSSDSIPIYLSFNQNVEPQNIERFISIEGLPALQQDNVSVYGSRVTINNLPLEYERNYIVRISANVRDLYGRTLGREERVEARVGAASSYMYVHNTGSRMLEAGYPPVIVWETQNPVSLSTGIMTAQNPYERLPVSGLVPVNIGEFPQNSKRYFFENLSPFLNTAGKGSVMLRWQYEARSQWEANRTFSGSEWLTVQVTDIGITTRYAYNTVLVWATRLSDGTAITNADVELLESGEVVINGRTNAQGLAVFNFSNEYLGSRFTDSQNNLWSDTNYGRGFRIRVSTGAGQTLDRAEFIPNNSHNIWRFGVEETASPFLVRDERQLLFLFTDRGLYRPGETVTFRGVDRNISRGQFSTYQGQYRIEVSSGAYQAPVIARLNGNTTANGGSFGTFELPANIDPGEYQIIYTRGTGGGGRETERSVQFTVANFERLRFESSLRFPDLPVFQGDRITASLSASYLAGGGLSGAPFDWHLTREPTGFLPGGTAGAWGNWYFGPENTDGRSFLGQGSGTLSHDGTAEITNVTRSDGIEGAVYRYRLEASVQDAARQEIASSGSVLVHPASFYIAARIDSGTLRNAAQNSSASGAAAFTTSDPSAYFLSAGRPATLRWALVAPDGEAPNSGTPENVTIQLVRHEWKQASQQGVGGRINLVWERVEEIVEERIVRNISPAANGFISGVFHFSPNTSGLWEVRLQSNDHLQRIAATRFRFYVSGAGWVRWGSDDVDTISLTADRRSYTPGETARILVRSPLEKGMYLLTLEREGIISQQIIELDGSALTIDIPVQESYIPVVYAALSSYTVRSGSPQNTYYEPDLDKPKGIFGVTPIYVDHTSRHYQVEIENSKAVFRPGEDAEITIKVSLNGRPAANTEVSFMAVDRGVLDLINYRVPDPNAFFYSSWNFPLGVRGADSRSLLIDPVTYTISDLQGGDSELARGADSKLDERSDFRPTAVFEPYLVTGPDGTVKVTFRLPDSLTTYRCTAVAVGTQNFGIREQDLRVSAPLTAIAALPRKLRWRDTGTVSLILTNLENTAVEALVSLEIEETLSLETGTDTETENQDTVLEVDGNDSQTVRILPGTSAEVQFKVAALGVGEARLVFTLRSPQVNERIVRTILVDRPILTETVTSIGNLGAEDSFFEEGMVLPSLVPEGTGNVTVSLSASRLAALKEAVRYLLDYPFNCIEQRVARLLPLAAFGEHMDAFDIASPLRGSGPWNPQKIVEDELVELARLQLSNGSFPFWPGGLRGDLFASLRMAHIVVLARSKGMAIPASLNTRQLLSWITAAENDRTYQHIMQDPFIKGYSLWIRAMHGERIGSEITAFLRRGDELGISGWAFAGLAALELGQRDTAVSAADRVRRFIRPGTRSLDLTDTYERGNNYWGYDSDRYALALMLFHTLSPADDMTTRLATSLIERQRRGGNASGIWNNTASTFWAVLAFGMVGDAESAEWRSSGSVLRSTVSLGGASLLNAEFRSYGGVPVSYNGRFTDAPVSELPRDVLLPLRIERHGPGRLFYTASLRYGIPVELASARDEGLGVFVETFDSEGRPVTNGRLRPGSTYTRRITVSSSRDRTFVALRSPVPSGAEIVDSVFITSATVPPAGDETRERQDYWDYYDPPPMRYIMDDEARYHWDFFRAGRQQVEYRFRAVMPGIYPTPPASAECMYEEEIFGRSAGELIRIE
ncbi:MAG: MG2 domain-containing protein [Treponema sp.]|nr:MG2 domain-containing protein [Treponema sp.]